jgi:hypothetical protein
MARALQSNGWKRHRDLMIRIVVQYTPALYAILGFADSVETCPTTLTVHDLPFYRTRSTDRWVLYRQAVQGSGKAGGDFDPAQQ